MPVPSAARDFRDLVIRLQRKMEFFDDLQSSCCGVSFAQCHALAAIRRAGKISLNDLAAGMGLDKSTVSRNRGQSGQGRNGPPGPGSCRPALRHHPAYGERDRGHPRIETGLSQCFESLYKSIDTSKRAPMMDSLRILLRRSNKWRVRDRDHENTPWIVGEVAISGLRVPQVSTRWDQADILGSFKARWGWGRMRYAVEPGLYAVGRPTAASPVLVSANYKMSFDRLRKTLSGLDLWILVIDTKGINVWCAAGKEPSARKNSWAGSLRSGWRMSLAGAP